MDIYFITNVNVDGNVDVQFIRMMDADADVDVKKYVDVPHVRMQISDTSLVLRHLC